MKLIGFSAAQIFIKFNPDHRKKSYYDTKQQLRNSRMLKFKKVNYGRNIQHNDQH